MLQLKYAMVHDAYSAFNNYFIKKGSTYLA